MALDYKKFKGVTNIGESLLSERLLRSAKMYLDWSFLGIGGFVNVANPTTTINSGNPNKLVPVSEPAVSDYKAWQTSRTEWVYETNPNFTTTTPNSVVVKVDGTTYASSDPTYGHYIDYPLGRVVFNSIVPITKVVTAQYAYRWVPVSIAADTPWFRELQKYSFNVEKSQFTQISKGEWSILGINRVQMPHIVIEQVPTGTGVAWELGSSNFRATRNLLLRVFAETDWERDKIVDILSYQQFQSFYMLDLDTIARNSDYPLTYRGSLVNTPKTYSELVDTYPWKKAFIISHRISQLECPSIYTGTVRWTVEIDAVGG